MAKNNINLGTLSGKLGDNVFWRAKGQQRVRTYVKRDRMAVGYEAGMRQSQFANLKGIYQWLPEDFKRACSLHRVGGNPYADFMRQYTQFGMGRDKQGFGVGRFLPVECAVSNGTFNVPVQTRLASSYAYMDREPFPVIPAVVLPMYGDAENIMSWAYYCQALLRSFPNLREGDYMHILLGCVYYDKATWGQAVDVTGFPFAYNQTIHHRLKIDTRSDIIFDNGNVPGIALCGGTYGEDDDIYCSGFGYHPDVINPGSYNYYSIVGAIMFERPENVRQQRYSPSVLRFNRSQIEILPPNARGSWNDYAARSFMKVLD